jgi:DNA-binding response OmpR family regulator
VPHHDHPKPFAVELGARALALGSKRQSRPRGVPIVVADLTVVPAELDARIGGQPLRLRRREFQVLYLLALAQGRPLTVSQLGRRLDVPDPAKARKAVTTQIVRLRAKLKQASSRSVISNRRSEGWALGAEPP